MSDEENIQEVISQLVAQGAYQQVIEMVDKLADQNSKVLDANRIDLTKLCVLRCDLLAKLGRYEEAASGYLELLHAGKASKDSINNLFLSLERLSRYDQMFSIALRLHNTNPEKKTANLLVDLGLKIQIPPMVISGFFKFLYPDFFETFSDRKIAVSQRISLREWCDQNKLQLNEFDHEQNVELSDAVTGMALSPYVTRPSAFAVIPNAIAICGFDYPFTSTGHVIDDVGYLPITSVIKFAPHYVSSRTQRVVTLWGEVTDVDEDVLFLSCPPFSAFGHWLIDFLPRLIVWHKAKNKNLKIFCSINLPSHFADTLARFGIGPDDFWGGDLYNAYRFKTITVCRLADWGWRSSAINEFLHKHLGPPISIIGFGFK